MQSVSAETPSAPPLFGVRVVLGSWLAQLFALGLTIGAYPVFIASIEANFGANRAQTSLGIPLVMAAGALVSPALGKLVDRGSPQWVMAAGSALMGLGFYLLAQGQTLPFMMLAWIGLVGLGQAMLGAIPANTVLANWFEQRRALMIAIAGTGITAGSATMPFIADYLITSQGWRHALLMMAAACVLVPLPAVLFCIRRSPAHLGLSADGLPARAASKSAAEENVQVNFLRDPNYWLTGLALACMPAAFMSLNTHVVSWAEYQHFGRGFGVTVLSSMALTTALSSLLFGQLCDRLGAINALRLALLLECIAWAVMLSAPGQNWFFAGALLFALGAGSFIPCQASLLSRLWPVAVFGQASGMVGLVIIAVIFALPTAVGLGYEYYQGYTLTMRWMFLPLILPIVLLTWLQRRMAAHS